MAASNSSPLRIVQIVPSLGIGGAERMAFQLAAHHVKSGNEVQIVVLSEDEQSELDIRAQKLTTVHYTEIKQIGHLKACLNVSRLLESIKPDIVHTHIAALSSCMPVKGFWRSPTRVHTVHNVAEREVTKRRMPLHRLMMRSAVPVSIANAVTVSLRKMYGDREYPEIWNGIEVNRFLKRDVDRSETFGRSIPEDAVVFLSVGRLSAQKNHRNLITAFEMLYRNHPSAILALSGDGPCRADLEAFVAEKNLCDSVLFLGIRDDVPNVLSAADVFVLSSDYEGSPLSVMEALTARLPVVSTSVGGVPELINDGKTGLLVPPSDADSLHIAMSKLMDPETRIAFKEAVNELDVMQYDISVTAKNYENLYRRLISERKGNLPSAA